MRDALEQVAPGLALQDVLARIGPPGMGEFLKEGAGFRLLFQALEAGPERMPDQPGRYSFEGTGLVADVKIEMSAALGVAVQSVTLTNPGAGPAPPIREIDAFHLPLTVVARRRPRACGFGGGLTDGFYPPRAYRPEEVCFGQGRDWLPAESTFNRWWTGKHTYTLESGADGRSSNPNLPLMVVSWDGASGQFGLWAALEWSGRWRLEMGTGSDWRFVFRGGPLVRGMVLEPGESIRLPRVHLGVYGSAGENRQEGFNSVRRYVARVLAPDVEGRRPWPFVAYVHWFGIHEDFSESLLRRQADRAAELGLEYFVVDAAWYPSPTPNFYDGVGNWERVDRAKFPDGLEPLADYVRARGMRFGLWFEPERARVGSDWAVQHPDWFWDAGRGPDRHLDLTQRRVQDGLIEMLSDWVSRLDIRWLRWDNNHPPGPYWDKADPTGKVQFAYLEGLYRVLETLLARHPNLMIDNCASGGNRVDFGMLRHAGTMVISDHAEDAHICRIMQTGGSRVLPGNYMNSSIYVGEHDGDHGVGPLELISRMAGCLTLCGHIANWSKRHTTLVRKHLDGYRTFRHLLMKDFHPLTPYPRSPDDWDVVEFVDPQTREAVVLAYRVRGERKSRTVHPVGLDPDATYEMRDPFSRRKAVTASGETLMARGLSVMLAPETAIVRHLKPIT